MNPGFDVRMQGRKHAKLLSQHALAASKCEPSRHAWQGLSADTLAAMQAARGNCSLVQSGQLRFNEQHLPIQSNRGQAFKPPGSSLHQPTQLERWGK